MSSNRIMLDGEKFRTIRRAYKVHTKRERTQNVSYDLPHLSVHWTRSDIQVCATFTDDGQLSTSIVFKHFNRAMPLQSNATHNARSAISGINCYNM